MQGEERTIRPPLRFTLGEFAGSVGDFGTTLPIVLGVALVCEVNLAHIFLFFASPQSLALIPPSVFGGLLIFAAVELGKHSAKTESYLVTGAIAALTLLANISIAFLVGLALAYLLRWRKERLDRPKK